MSSACRMSWPIRGPAKSGRSSSPARPATSSSATSTAQGVRHYSAILVPEFEEGHAVGTVLVTVRDITQRVEAEERYSTIIRNSLEGFCILDRDGPIHRGQ